MIGRQDDDGAASGIGQDAAGGDELAVVGRQFAARLVGDDEHQEGGVFDDPDGGAGGGGGLKGSGLRERGAAAAPVVAEAGSGLDAGGGAFGPRVAAAPA